MFKKITLYFLFMIFSLTICNGAELSSSLKNFLIQTHVIANQGHYEQALERYIWFHNNAIDLEPEFKPVILSYGVGLWVKLAKEYPPALFALKNRRDENIEALKNGQYDLYLFEEIVVVNEMINENNVSIDLFKFLDTEKPLFAEICWDKVDHIMVRYEEYEIANKYYGNLFARFESLEKNFYLLNDMLKNVPDNDFLEINKKRYLADTYLIVKVAESLGDNDTISKIKERHSVAIEKYNIRTTKP